MGARAKFIACLLLALAAALPAWLGAQTAQPSGAASSGNAADGARLYVDRGCWQCHGLVGQGGGIAGPRLAGRVQVWVAFANYVRRPTEEMIPYTSNVLPDGELMAIFEWLRTLPPPPAVDDIPLLAPQR